MRLSSYTIRVFTDIGKMNPEEAVGFNQPIVWGIKRIDLIPINVLCCMIFDVLQVFIPRLRLQETKENDVL